MSLKEDYFESLLAKAPLEVVAEFLTLNEVLCARLVSTRFVEAICNLSSARCAQHLHERLVSQSPTVHLVSHACWNQTLDLEGMEAFMQRPDGGSLECMLRCFRVFKCLPMEAGIAFCGKYGRHCVPMQWNIESKRVEAIIYASCRRQACPTCRLKIDMDARERPPCEIYKDYDIWIPDQSKRCDGRRRVDLSKFYPKCIPNLPRDLLCPHCSDSEKRTLVLSIISYKSSTPPPHASGKPLTYTPFNDNDYSEPEVYDGLQEDSGEENVGQSLEDALTVRKHPREENQVEDTFAYPLIFDEIASPKAYQAIEESDRAKYAISIHCVSCEKFGMLAPANPCSHEHFRCRMRAKEILFGGQNVLVGSMMVRNKCHNTMCNRSTRCMSDCQKFRHGLYADPDTKLPFKCWCPHCHPAGNGRYCDGCAWLTSVCHHS